MTKNTKRLIRLFFCCIVISVFGACGATDSEGSDTPSETPDPNTPGTTDPNTDPDTDPDDPDDQDDPDDSDMEIQVTWNTGATPSGWTRIANPGAYPIRRPVAGNYPQGLYKWRYNPQLSPNGTALNYEQTLEWLPAVSKTFALSTEYTAVLRFDPRGGGNNTFKGTPENAVKNLPEDGVKSINVTTDGDSLVVSIVFKKTASKKAPAELLFEDEFKGTSLDKTKWELVPQAHRQGRSSWRDDMVSVSNEILRIGFRIDSSLGSTDWVRTGGVRTRNRDNQTSFNGSMKWDNGYGYYETRIKFPQTRGVWGAFWLMSPQQGIVGDEARDGVEIDIIKFISRKSGTYS
jgi:hypothetical protein